jgi:hypothetical protein
MASAHLVDIPCPPIAVPTPMVFAPGRAECPILGSADRLRRPTKRAPDGWWAARFLKLFLNDERFPFRELVLASRR